MILKDKTILITGGGSGIGLEAARQFLSEGAKVIITGRNQDKLDIAKNLYPGLVAIKSDAANEEEAKALFSRVKEMGGIDILYNNAGVSGKLLSLGIANEQHFKSAAYEIQINYLAVVRLNDLFLNMLKSRKQAVIINTSSILRYVPAIIEPTYSASKAALGFYTESLRKHLQLLNSTVKVVEVLPPLVATEMTVDIQEKMLTPEQFVNGLISGLKKDRLTIRVGDTKLVYLINRFFPKLAYSLVNPKKNYKLLQS